MEKQSSILLKQDGTLLDEALASQAGMQLDRACGGNGRCGRCRVLLLAGKWDCDGQILTPQPGQPLEARACRTRLVSATGEVQIPDSRRANAAPSAETSWEGAPLTNNQTPAIAIDLGTTTVAVARIQHGQVQARASLFNQQARFGADVMSRISYADKPNGLKELQQAAITTIQTLLKQVGTDGVRTLTLAGNTAMSCLLHGISPHSLGFYPFTPPCTEFPVCPASKLGLRTDAELLTVPAIGAFVGGDLTAGLGEISLAPGELLVDIGTNCEIILRTEAGYFCTSAAAGPAFEGAGLPCSCRAVAGAIDHVKTDFSYTVIGGAAPAGLCGSALIDFLAVAHASGRLSSMGRYLPAAPDFRLAGLSIPEKSIEELLKAKAAVFSGIQTLCAYAGVQPSRLYLAGGFARHLDLASAQAIGMLPECPAVKIGNSSLAGAARLASNPDYLAKLRELSHAPQVVHLNNVPDFEDNFIDALFL